MRICMLAYTFYETDNRVRRYGEALAKRGDQVDAIVLRMPGQAKYDKIKGVNVYRIQQRKINEKTKFSYLFKLLIFLISSSMFLMKQHFKKSYDLIHVHSVPDFEVFAAWFPKLTGTKIILDIHDIVPEFFMSKFKVTSKSLIFKLLVMVERASIRFSNYVIIANHLWYQKLISRSASEEKCTVILNYPDPAIFYRRKRQRTDDKFMILYPGTLSRHQGLGTVFKAIARLGSKAHNLELHIYGDGTDKYYFMKIVEELYLKEYVHFHGPLPLEEIADAMAEADLAIEPKMKNSFSNEALSTKILEFMMLGVPIIASDTKIHKYYFNDCVIRFFESENDEDLARRIFLLRRDQSIADKLVAEAFKFVRRNNWGVRQEQYFQLVDSLVNISRN